MMRSNRDFKLNKIDKKQYINDMQTGGWASHSDIGPPGNSAIIPPPEPAHKARMQHQEAHVRH
jgi:hypothetical protein